MTDAPGGWHAPGWTDGTAPPTGYGQPTPEAAPTWTTEPGAWYGETTTAPRPGVVPLRPLAVGELLDGAIKIVRRYPRPTLGLSAGLGTVVILINVLLVLLLDTGATSASLENTDGTTTFTAGFGTGVVSSGPGALVSYLVRIVLTGALVSVVGKAVLGQAAPLGEVWKTVRPRLWALLGLSLLSGLVAGLPVVVAVALTVLLAVTAGGLGIALGVLLVLAGIAASANLYVRIALAAPALVLEHTGIRQSLRRSSTLVKGSWWRCFGLLLLAAIISGVVSGIVTLPVSLIALYVTGGDTLNVSYLITAQIASGLASVVVAPFSAAVIALLYVDRRMRAEGLDVALQAAAEAPST